MIIKRLDQIGLVVFLFKKKLHRKMSKLYSQNQSIFYSNFLHLFLPIKNWLLNGRRKTKNEENSQN